MQFAQPTQRTIVRARSKLLAVALCLAACNSGSAEFETRAVVEPELRAARKLASEESTVASIAAAALLSQVENSPHAWMRAKSLVELREREQDWIVPRLLLRLKFERDEAVRVELARTLARFGNWSGLDALFEQGARRLAMTALDELTTAAGVSGKNELWRLWNHGDFDERLPRSEPSARHRQEAWEYIAKLGGENRADAVFVLSKCDAWVAGLLAQALHEKSVALSNDAASALREMGPRGNLAGPDLLLALESSSLATEAALALGSVAYPLAGPSLVLRLEPEFELELRIAAARALGGLSLPDTFSALERRLAPSEPNALRIAAANSLMRAEPNGKAVRVALELMRAGGDSAALAERTLELWVTRLSTSGNHPFSRVLERWKAPVGPPGIAPTEAESIEQRKRRGALIESLLRTLTQ